VREKGMKTPSLENPAGLSRLKLFLALSRTPHGLLDIAAPALCALLWLGKVPSAEVVVLGLLTAFSGYTAVYALNDVVDFHGDRKKIRETGGQAQAGDLDAVFVRHPMAQGMLKYVEGLLWTAGWAALTILGSYLLNPVCTGIFLAACLLEIVYCLLLRVTYLRGIISGFVKNSGGVAAVFAVDPNPGWSFLTVLFLWFFFWEIGGQNVPNDWIDLEEDRRMLAKTIPVRFGPGQSIRMLCGSLILSLIMSLIMYWASPANLSVPYLIGAVFCGLFFLLAPAHRLLKTPSAAEASALFNRASYYPLAMLAVTLISTAI
jgi:4-hydroxybenzoate polyprenyltransferase